MSDTSPPDDEETAPFRPLSELVVALRFLTRLPVPFARTVEPTPLFASMRLFGLAGALIGACSGILIVLLSFLHLPVVMAPAVAIGLGLFLTGALHEDGLADTADGLLGGATRERRLEIMRDSRIGTYGACALVLALLARASAFSALAELAPGQTILVLAACGAFSRAMVVDMMWATKPARSDGLAAQAGRPSRNVALFAICSSGVLAIWAGWAIEPVTGVEAMAAALVVTAVMRRLATRLVGGQTGDICGAVQVLSEIAMLTTFLASIH